MASIFRKESILINIPASEIIKKCRFAIGGTGGESDVTGYYTDDKPEKYALIRNFIDASGDDWYVDSEKFKEYARDMKRYVYPYKDKFVNKMDSFNKLSALFGSHNVKLPPMLFGGATGRYLKFDNSDELCKDFKETMYEGVSNLVVEKRGEVFYVYPELKKDFFKKLAVQISDIPPVIEDEVEESIEEEAGTVSLKRYFPLNFILYGAPGTGKTYSTAEYAVSIVENKSTKIECSTKSERAELMKKYKKYVDEGKISFTTFHQSYSYEDFIQGLRPKNVGGVLEFVPTDGIFKSIADKAKADPNSNYVLVVDEINRANISKVLGELITLLEEDKRLGEVNELSAKLPSGEQFSVPSNLYFIGTMNTADKSISLIDVALRRRFEFICVPVNYSVLSGTPKVLLQKLNDKLYERLDNNSDLLIGHAYFIDKTDDDIANVFNRSIVPLLYEYFFDDGKKVKALLDEVFDGTSFEAKNDKLSRIKVEKK